MMRWTFSEIEILEKLIGCGLTYDEISKRMKSRSASAVRNKANEIGLKSKIHKDKHTDYKCIQCGKKFRDLKSNGRKFCSHTCFAIYNNISRGMKNRKISKCKNCKKEMQVRGSVERIYCSRKCAFEGQYEDRILKWKNGEITGYTGKTKQICPWLRRYLLDTRGARCERCGWDGIHPIDGKPLVEINHIDGNAMNNSDDNLEIVCPNCHSMTPNFRSRNKQSSRDRT